MNAGDESFQRESELTLSMFESKLRVCNNFTFTGTEINTEPTGILTLQQKHYMFAL